MPNPVYLDVLTKESEARLAHLVRDLPHPVSLAGGHAVRLRVEAGWRAAFGSGYFGSRDIDLAYFVDPAWSLDELKASAAGQAPDRIVATGFRRAGSFRFSIFLDDEGRELAAEPPPPKMRDVDYHELSLDPMVTNFHDELPKLWRFKPIDEPILARVFHEPDLRDLLPAMGPNVYLPKAPVLVATKLKSLPERTKDDKAVKDLCDLYALTRYGGTTVAETRRVVHRVLPEAAARVADALGSPFLAEAAGHLDLDERAYRAVVAPLAVA